MPAHVGPVVALRVADRLADERERGEVQHPVEPFANDGVHVVWVEEVCDHQPGSVGDRFAMSLPEVVEHDHLMLRGQQMAGDDRPDVAGAAGD